MTRAPIKPSNDWLSTFKPKPRTEAVVSTAIDQETVTPKRRGRRRRDDEHTNDAAHADPEDEAA